MKREFLKTVTLGIVAALCLEPSTASAWLLTETHPDAIYHKETKVAAVALIEQLVAVINSWLVSERDDKTLELPSSDVLRGISSTFNDLSQKDDSIKTNLNFSGELKEYAAQESERLSIKMPMTYADVFQITSTSTMELAEQIDSMRNVNFGPKTSTDIQKRAAFGRLGNRMFRLVEIANLLALMLQFPAS